jgi:putative membrane protein
MKMQVADHEKTVDLFEKASKNVKDSDVKSYVDNTLPKLKAHLEAARTLNKSL